MKDARKCAAFVALCALLFSCGCVEEDKAPAAATSSTTQVPASSSTPITPSSSSTSSSSTIASTTTTEATTTSYSTTTSFSAVTATSLAIRQGLSADIKLPRDTYHSGDIMNIAVMISSPKKLGNVGVRVYGIYAGRYRLNQSTTVTLEPGENTVPFTYTSPKCNTCSGIAAGKYVIKAEILYNDEVAAIAMKNVDLRQ